MKPIAIGCLSTIGVLVLICSGIVFMPSRARRSLPWNAADVHEHYEDARLGSDFVRCLKAKIAKSDFDDYANRLELTEAYDRVRHANLNMDWNLCSQPWWNPPDTLDGVRFQPTNGEDVFAMAAWHKGYVYFVVFSW